MFKQIIGVFATILVLASCNNLKDHKTDSNKLIVFHAGSLSIPLKQVVAEFKNLHPDAEVVLESAGSVKCARKITDLNKSCDIMASADYTVIDEMLIPEYASWNIKFASNEMCIVYHKKSKYANEISKDNWYEILMKEDVRFGRSDPNSDPCGYRAVLVSQLAEKHYESADLSKNMMAKNVKYIRPKEVDLLALLETNTIDYIFLYRSVAEQHGLKYLLLPDKINLKKTEHKDFYKQAKVEINGKKPGEKITKRAEPMVYGITILDKAPNKKLAQDFVEFILSKEGGVKVMEQNGQPSMVPSVSSTYTEIPEQLKSFALTNDI